jgi:hypothetical protein
MTAPAEISIRSFREPDRAQLGLLWARVFPDDAPRNAPDRMIDGSRKVHRELLFVAEHADEIAGAVIAGFDGVRGWIYHLAVAAEHRRRGIATALMRAEEGLHRVGCLKINLPVRTSNSNVVAFYRAIGYQVEDRISMGRALD